MQITHDTADTIETLSGGQTFVYDDLANPDLNIRYGTFYLNHLLDRFGGNVVAALAGYNGGPENVEQWGGSDLQIDDIPFPETRAYVEDVLRKREQYRDNYADELGLRVIGGPARRLAGVPGAHAVAERRVRAPGRAPRPGRVADPAAARGRLRRDRRRRPVPHARRRDRRAHGAGRGRARGRRARARPSASPTPARDLGVRGRGGGARASTPRRSCSPASRRSPASSSSTTPRPGWRSPTGSWSTAATWAGSRRRRTRRRCTSTSATAIRSASSSRSGWARSSSATDPAWLIQPYIAWGAALLALALWSLADAARRLAAPARAGRVPGRAIRAALRLLPLGRDQGGHGGRPRRRVRRPARSVAAGGPDAAIAGAARRRGAGRRAERRRARLARRRPSWSLAIAGVRHAGASATARRGVASLPAALGVLVLPTIVSGALLPPTSSPLTDAGARGNLAEPLEPAQAAGIWPVGDFRFHPDAELAAYALIAIACLAAVAGLAWCRRRGDAAPLVYVGGALASCAALVVVGSPWVGGKALATASPAIPFAALLGVGWLAVLGRRLRRRPASRRRSPAGSCGRTRSATATSAWRPATSSPSWSGSASGSRARGRR